MNRFKIFTIVFLLRSHLLQIACQDATGAKPLELKTVAGFGSAAYGLYNLMSGKEKRSAQIQKAAFDYEKAFYNDIMKTDVVGQNTDMLTANYQNLRHKFNIFSSSIHDHVDTIRNSVKQFIKNSNYKFRLLKAQQQASEQAKSSDQGANDSGSNGRKARRLRKRLASNQSGKSLNEPLVLTDELGRALPAPHYINLNVQRIRRAPKNTLNLSISRSQSSKLVL